jgi:hypothetical protein
MNSEHIQQTTASHLQNSLIRAIIKPILRNALDVRRLVHPHRLPGTVYCFGPGDPPLNELLHLRPQFRLGQGEVIDSAGTQDSHVRKSGATAVHECPARLAKVVGHGRVGAHCLSLAKGRKVVLAADVPQVGVGNGNV